MTVVWYCDSCNKQVWLKPSLERQEDGTYAYDLEPHLRAHQLQHGGS